MRFAPVRALRRVDRAPPSAIGSPATVVAGADRVERHERPATTLLWESHPSEPPPPRAPGPSTYRESAQSGAYTRARRYSPESLRAARQQATECRTYHGDTETRKSALA